MTDVFSDPSSVSSGRGTVKVVGPDGVDVVLTAQAAVETGRRLVEAAAKSHGEDLLQTELETTRARLLADQDRAAARDGETPPEKDAQT